MSLFRNEHPHLGPNTRVDMSKSASAQYVVKVPAFTIITVPNLNAATQVNLTVFQTPSDTVTYGQYKVVNVITSCNAAAASGATIDVVKAVDAVTIANGTSILSAAVNINTITLATETAATVVTDGSNVIAGGSRIGIKLGGTLTGLTDACVTLILERV